MEVKIRSIKIEDASDISKYCFNVSTKENIEEQIKKDIERIKSGEMSRFVAEIDERVIGAKKVSDLFF